MSARIVPDLAKWPFFLGDAILLALAFLVYAQVRLPLSTWAGALISGCGLAGAVLAIIPFVLEYRAAVRMAESGALASTVAEIRNLEMIAAQIAAATARWQVVQEHSASTVGAAKEISQKMAAEAGAFSEFLQKANDAERSNLRLEVEKLRRMENDWLQVIVRQLDHTFALYKAAERSGQAGLIEQMGLFQNSCRESARRIGLVPLVPTIGEPLDPHRHRLSDPEMQAAAGSCVGEVMATGYTYQGRLIRPAVVVPQETPPEATDTPAEEDPVEPQEQTLL